MGKDLSNACRATINERNRMNMRKRQRRIDLMTPQPKHTHGVRLLKIGMKNSGHHFVILSRHIFRYDVQQNIKLFLDRSLLRRGRKRFM